MDCSKFFIGKLAALTLACFIGSNGPLEARSQTQGFDGDITKITDVLVDRGRYTFVPKRSILFVPKGMEKKIRRQKNTKHVDFAKFYRMNQV